MIRSLYSGVSGMKNHQIRMDVIGNNIANVNTSGFKSGRANFQDTLYQLIRSASAGTASALGGINPSQVGLGMSVSSITSNMGQGNMQSTGRTLDLAIQGNGWFAVSQDGGTTQYFTREGIFYIDDVGNLVNSNGYCLLDDNGEPINLGTDGVATLNISQAGVITGTDLAGANLAPVIIGLAMFPNQEGLERVGQNLFRESAASGVPVVGVPGAGGYGTINSCYLEMSNVDLTEEFTNMIITQRGYQANARTITTSDEMLEELLNVKR
ncbi:flagellar hook-basal body complex protein [Pelotomaculum propionicicum]|uniref:flagellar hook-basal body complex protein n=1 Tax=Pelotomaculum propionicicum TaxID=258475 RepID=UPI003B7B5EC2